MPRRISYNPNIILAPGTQIVTRVPIKAAGMDREHPTGAVAVIIKSPVDHEHAYRVRFADQSEAPLRRTQFAVLKEVQRDRIWSADNVLDEFDLMDCVIYRCVVGSRAYGLDHDASDTDRRGVYLPPAEMQWSLYGVPEQLENNETEECYWEFQKFLTLALKANPNVLECLYTPIVEHASRLAQELLDMRDAFLSKLVYQTYNGYVLSQFKKLSVRLDNDRDIKWKHAMHLIRLLLAGITILREGTVPVCVEEHRGQLLSIRDGEMPWPEVDAWRLELHREFDRAYAQTKLPERPDYERVNALLVKARGSSIRGFSRRTGFRVSHGPGRPDRAPAYVILRMDLWPLQEATPKMDSTRLNDFAWGLTPTHVVWSMQHAEQETKRLNKLNGGKGCRYFYEYTRVEMQPECEQTVNGPAQILSDDDEASAESSVTRVRPLAKPLPEEARDSLVTSSHKLLAEIIAEQPFPLLFVTISGAHLYGFPSADSDYDLRGVHVLPLADVIGLHTQRETMDVSTVRDNVEIDLVTHDAKKFFGLMLKRNGYVLEQLYSPLVLYTTPQHEELKAIARDCVTRHHAHHYLGFARTQWSLFDKDRRVKPLLYIYRVLLTGIHLMRTGQIEANLVQLNEVFKLPYIDDLVAQKMAGSEKGMIEGDNLAFHEREYQRLTSMLEEARNKSRLPNEPTARDALNDLLCRIRCDQC